jgi:hypothetical protein
MVVSEIQSLYRDEDDLFRTVIKRIYEEKVGDKWVVKKVEIIFEDGEPAPLLGYQHGWIICPHHNRCPHGFTKLERRDFK